jgi:spore coat protein U-like protein
MLKTSKSIRTAYTTLATGLALSGLLVAGTAGAATDTANLAVSATVSANCIISTTAVDFDEYDPVVANKTVPLDVQGIVTVTCTSGPTFQVTLGQGLHDGTGSAAAPARRLSDGTNFLNYSLSNVGFGGTVWSDSTSGVDHIGTGVATNLAVFGQIAAGQNPPVGSYSDTVLATVTF